MTEGHRKRMRREIMTNKQNIATCKELNGIELERAVQWYKCPTCKHAISITRAEFIKGIAMTSCSDCGSNGVAIDDVMQ
jgi:predicted RNA-binding Zn-ribbon protein involved in translation (DUF1610 family)